MKIPAVCFLGLQNSGKTTLIVRLVRALKARGLRVGTIKHVSHGFQLDTKGKDSYRHFHAGTVNTLVVSRKQMGLFVHLDRAVHAEELIRKYFADQDLVLVEGYSDSCYPKIEVYRCALGEPPIFRQRKITIAALVTDRPRQFPRLKTFRTSDISGIARFIMDRYVSRKKT